MGSEDWKQIIFVWPFYIMVEEATNLFSKQHFTELRFLLFNLSTAQVRANYSNMIVFLNYHDVIMNINILSWL